MRIDRFAARVGEGPSGSLWAVSCGQQIKLPNGKALPKAGAFAHAEAKTVAQRITDRVAGRSPSATFDGHGYCWIELGGGRAGFVGGDFYGDPEPRVRIRQPGRPLHWGKVAFEQWWLEYWL